MSIYWIVSEILSFVSSFCEFDETLLNNPIFHIRNSGNSKLCATCIYIYIYSYHIYFPHFHIRINLKDCIVIRGSV